MQTLEGAKLIGFNIEGRLSVAAELRLAIIDMGTLFDGISQFLDFGDRRQVRQLFIFETIFFATALLELIVI